VNGARWWLVLGALNGFVAVGAGAYGWHSLTVDDSALRDVFAVGVDYQMWHALALFAVAWMAVRRPGAVAPHLAGIAFVAGIVLFSGSLYAMGLTGTMPVAGAAPAGGVCLMAGWAALAWAALRG
jgi:uncharacterized membrane protein YgdD (TMEM256/DUF423 family)